MNTPWIILTLLAIAAFAFFEARAFRHPDRQNTLSRSIYNLGKTWPLSIMIMGMFVGGLAVHFEWHWCPDGGTGTGALTIPPPGIALANDRPAISIASTSYVQSNECMIPSAYPSVGHVVNGICLIEGN